MFTRSISTIVSMVFCALAASAAPPVGRHFDRAIFVLFENTNFAATIQQPFFKALSQKGTHFTNFVAETHPSQANYIALTAGSLAGVKGDGNVDLNISHIADLLEEQGLTWKVYAEDYPGNCFLGSSKGPYARKHNPFISFVNIQKSPTRCAQIVNAVEFDKDTASGSLPNYVFYVPNIKNDGHDTGVAFADKWYAKKFGPYFADSNFMKDTVVITTFDENGGSPRNQIYTNIIGPNVIRQDVSDLLNHYSLLKMIEDNWGLKSLGKEDLKATDVPDIWINQ